MILVAASVAAGRLDLGNGSVFLIACSSELAGLVEGKLQFGSMRLRAVSVAM
jgi:hypothetical protein